MRNYKIVFSNGGLQPNIKAFTVGPMMNQLFLLTVVTAIRPDLATAQRRTHGAITFAKRNWGPNMSGYSLFESHYAHVQMCNERDECLSRTNITWPV